MALRVVIDTDVMVAGFASPSGASRRLLQAAIDGRVQMLASTALLIEYEAVLTRPAVLMMARAPVEDVRAVLEGFADLCVLVPIDYHWRPQARDPGDDLVLEAAINGGARVVASFNVRDMQAGARRFGIAVERPGMVVRRIAG